MQSELYNLGATRHMSLFHKQFIMYQPINAYPITAANNKVFHAIGVGDLQIEVLNGTTLNKVLLKDMLYVLDLCLTVMSIRCIMKAGFTVQFADDVCHIKKGDDSHIIGCIPASTNGLFKVKHMFGADDSTTTAEPSDILTLHCRMGHVMPFVSLSYLIWCTLSSCTYIPHLSCTTGIYRLLDTYPRLPRSQYLAALH